MKRFVRAMFWYSRQCTRRKVSAGRHSGNYPPCDLNCPHLVDVSMICDLGVQRRTQ